MGYYYIPSESKVTQLDDAVYAGWVAASNPKAQYYQSIPNPPDPRATWNGTAWVLSLDDIKAQCIARINAECRQRLFTRFGPPEEQISRSLGIYGDAERDALAPGISATIDASNDASDLVLVATTVAEAEAVQPNWPVI